MQGGPPWPSQIAVHSSVVCDCLSGAFEISDLGRPGRAAPTQERRQLLFIYLNRIAGLMVFDLKPQELMNRCERFGIGRRNKHAASPVDRFESIFDLRFQPSHVSRSGRSFPVGEHRQAEVTFAELLGDVRQMASNLIAARAVIWIISGDFDRSAVLPEPKTVSGLLVAKTHCLVATLVNVGVMLAIVSGMLIVLKTQRICRVGKR